MARTVTVDELLTLTTQLSTIEKVQLIERLAPQITHDLHTPLTQKRKSLRGLWRGLNITSKEVDTARQEMWNNFSRTDI